jgi:mRNA interferase MazF
LRFSEINKETHPTSYNQKVGLMLCCPITTKAKGYPFEVEIKTKEVTGAVLADQLKSLDWRARNTQTAGVVSAEVLAEVRSKLLTLVS